MLFFEFSIPTDYTPETRTFDFRMIRKNEFFSKRFDIPVRITRISPCTNLRIVIERESRSGWETSATPVAGEKSTLFTVVLFFFFFISS